MNMFCGFLSIINASQGKYMYAAGLIIIAGVFDALDGLVVTSSYRQKNRFAQPFFGKPSLLQPVFVSIYLLML